MNQKLIWYDSRWLETYNSARALIQKGAPEKLELFDNRLSVLRTDPEFKQIKLKNFFDKEKLDLVRSAAQSIPKNLFDLHEMKRFGRFIVQDYPVFTKLQAELADQVSALAGESLELSYNFFSMYTKMGLCEPHLDAPSAKWTLDICIDQSEPWPIYFSQTVPWPEAEQRFGEDWRSKIKSDDSLNFKAEMLEPGDAVFFSGGS